MHEIGLLENVLSKVKQEALRKGLKEVKCIDLVIGKMQGITSESLKHALEITTAGDPMFKNCQVRVKEKEGSMKCLDCDHIFDLQTKADSCPLCGGIKVEIASGLEFYVESYAGN